MFKKIIHVFVGTSIIQGGNILLYIVLARVLSIVDFATYRQLFLFQAIVIAIVFSSIPSALLYFTGRSSSRVVQKSYIRTIEAFTLVMGLVIAIILIMLNEQFAAVFNNYALESLLPFFSIVPLCAMYIGLLSPILISQDITNKQFKYSLIISLVKVLPAIVISLAGGSLDDIVIGVVVSMVCSCIIISYVIRAHIGTISRNNLHTRLFLKKLIIFISPLLIASTLSVLGLKVDHLIVSSLLGVVAYGIYAVGSFEIPIFQLIQNSAGSVLLPKVSDSIKKNDYNRAEKEWSDVARKTSILTLPIAGYFILESEFIIKILFGIKYIDAHTIFSIFCALAFVRILSFSTAIRAMGKTKYEMVLTLVYLCMGIAGGYLSAKYYDSNVVALWVLINTIIYSIMISKTTSKLTGGKIKIFRVYPWRSVLLSVFIISFVILLKSQSQTVYQYGYIISFLISLVLMIILWLISKRKYEK